MKSINEMQEENILKVIKDGPRLRYDYSTWIVARDPKKKRVCIGGLGCMSVGQMWCDEEPEHTRYAGYKKAPIIDAPDSPEPWFRDDKE